MVVPFLRSFISGQKAWIRDLPAKDVYSLFLLALSYECSSDDIKTRAKVLFKLIEYLVLYCLRREQQCVQKSLFSGSKSHGAAKQ